MKTSIPRLHSYRLKSGGAKITVLYTAQDCCPLIGYARIQSGAFDLGVAGFAMVSWDESGSSVTDIYTTQSGPISYMSVPEVVKVALIRHIADEDTKARINELYDAYGGFDDVS